LTGWWRTTSRIGVELDGRRVRAAQFQTSRGVSVVHAVAEVLLPADSDGQRSAELIAGVLSRRGFLGTELCVGVPVGVLQSDLVEVPAGAADSPSDGLREMFAKATRRTPDDLEVGFWRGVEGASAAFAVALSHDEARRLVYPLRDAGLDVAAIGCAGSALAEVVTRLEVHPGEVTGVVRFGWDHNHFVLLRGGDVLYQRSMDTPGFEIALDTHEAATRRATSALADEIASTLDCVPRTFPGVTLERVFLSGLLAERDHLAEMLRKRLVHFDVACLDGFAPAGSRFDVAAGLALAEVGP